VTAFTTQENINFQAMDIPISTNTTHNYIIDWSTLSAGGEGVTLQIDINGDGSIEQNIPLANRPSPSNLPVKPRRGRKPRSCFLQSSIFYPYLLGY